MNKNETAVDKEAEFLKTVKAAKERHEQRQQKKEAQSPTRIGATFPLSTLAPPEKRLCNCGTELVPLLLPAIFGRETGYHYPQNCEACCQKLRDTENRRALRQKRREKQSAIKKELKQIPERYQNARLAHLSRAFATSLLSFEPTTGLVLTGPVGTGKTYALSALIRKLITLPNKHRDWNNELLERISWERLCIEVRATFQKESQQTEDSILRRLIRAEYLVVEDLGAGKAIDVMESDFSRRLFYVVLDSRLERCRPTFISTNKTQQTLANTFDERIASRLSMFRWVGVGGDDKRKHNALP